MKLRILEYIELRLHILVQWLALKRTRLGIYIYKSKLTGENQDELVVPRD